jgi:arabinan endo-1,5-alpha-L-arabinosidase
VAIGTGPAVGGGVFPMLTSPDLVHWTPQGGVLTPLDTGLGTDYWAPEMVLADDRCWLYYSVGHGHLGHHLRVAVADSPLGPFSDCGLNLTPDERFAIDPHPFTDIDGSRYLYYARDVLEGERVGTQLAVAPLVGMTALSGPGRQVLAPSADWQIYERGRSMYGGVYDWHTLEGPTVREHNGTYYCVYSGGSFLGEGYAVAWARADHPLGPWTEPAAGDHRLLATVPGHVRGPGHNSIVTTAGGTDMLVYHAWDEAGTKRQMCIDPLEWADDGPRTPGPSWQERPLPR